MSAQQQKIIPMSSNEYAQLQDMFSKSAVSDFILIKACAFCNVQKA